MEALLAAIEGSELAAGLRYARWGYAAVNAAHILGIALLVGAILPFDLRLMGLWRTVPRAALARVLVPVAATGLALAVLAGAALFAVRASDYAGIGFFQAKLALVAIGATSAGVLHLTYGPRLEGASRPRLAAAGALSMVCWLGALVCGRLIAFAEG